MRNQWPSRARAWDDNLEHMAQRHARQAMAHLNVLMTPARAILERMKDPGWAKELDEIPIADLLALAVKCAAALSGLMKAERLARGQPAALAEDGDRRRESTPDVLQRINDYTAVFERILAQGEEKA